MLTVYKVGKWIVDKIGVKALICLPLLLVALGSSAYGLSSTIRLLDPDLLIRFVFLAVILAWLLARSRMPTWLAWVFMPLFGLVVVFIAVGELFSPFVALVRAGVFVAWQYLHYEILLEVDLTTLDQAYANVYYGAAGIFSTLRIWGSSLFSGSPIKDRIAIFLVWSYAHWLAACWGGWFFRRKKWVVFGLLPSGAMLASVLAYTWSETRVLIPFLFVTLVLLGVTHYYSSEERWENSGMDYPEDLAREAPLITLGISTILVLLAVFVSTFSIQSIVEAAREGPGKPVEVARPVIQSFGLEQSPYREYQQFLRGGLPRRHLIGSGPELSERLIMTVQITGGGTQLSGDDVLLPLYWRNKNFDRYTGSGWESSRIAASIFSAGKPVFVPNLDYHTILQQDFRLVRGEAGNLYAAGDVLTADTDFEVFLRPLPEGAEISGVPIDLFGASINSRNYRVQSVIPVVSEEELRAAPIGFPAWIRNRYLFLPENIPTRVLMLARGLVVNAETAYDRALILEDYLRSFEYSLDIEQPPGDRDIVDYFLFDLRKGYCDYYATAMVVMARAVALPARMVIGYYRGEYEETNSRYIVTEADAHSWVEIYFSGIGWVPFEPTAIRSEIDRLPKHLAIVGKDEENLTSLEHRPAIDLPPIGIVGIGIAGVILGMTVFSQAEIWILQRMAFPKALEKLYRRLYRHGQNLGVPASKDRTPYEFARSLEDRISHLSKGSVFHRWIYPAMIEVRELTEIYAQMLYSDRPVNIQEMPKIFYLWRHLRRRMWLARWRQKIARNVDEF